MACTCNKRIRDANLKVLRYRKSNGLVEQRYFNGGFYRLGHLAGKPFSDNEVDDRLKAACEALGETDGETVAGNTALSTGTARRLAYWVIFQMIRKLEQRSLTQLVAVNKNLRSSKQASYGAS